jgi:hypothetical protein
VLLLLWAIEAEGVRSRRLLVLSSVMEAEEFDADEAGGKEVDAVEAGGMFVVLDVADEAGGEYFVVADEACGESAVVANEAGRDRVVVVAMLGAREADLFSLRCWGRRRPICFRCDAGGDGGRVVVVAMLGATEAELSLLQCWRCGPNCCCCEDGATEAELLLLRC